jgi:hypothetical protein
VNSDGEAEDDDNFVDPNVADAHAQKGEEKEEHNEPDGEKEPQEPANQAPVKLTPVKLVQQEFTVPVHTPVQEPDKQTEAEQLHQLREAFKLDGAEYENKLACVQTLRELLSWQDGQPAGPSGPFSWKLGPIDKAMSAGVPGLLARYLSLDDEPVLQSAAVMALAPMFASGSSAQVQRVAREPGVCKGLIALLLPAGGSDSVGAVDGDDDGKEGKEEEEEEEEKQDERRMQEQRVMVGRTALKSLGDIASIFDARATGLMVDAGVLPKVVPLLGHGEEAVRIQAERTLSGMCAGGTHEHCQVPPSPLSPPSPTPPLSPPPLSPLSSRL